MSTKQHETVSSVTNHNLPKLGVIFLGRRRPGFDMEWGRRQEEKTRAWLRGAGFAVFEPAEKAIDDPSLRRAVTACVDQGAQVLILLQTTMGDGRLAPTLAQLWPDPLVLWATPEKPDGDMISSCSLVGAHAWGSVLRQMGHTFEFVYGDADAPQTQQRLKEAVRMAATARGLRSARLGLIGGQAPGYFAMSGDPFSIHQGMGAQVQTFSLLEFANVVNALSEEAVAEDVAKVKALGLPHKDTSDADLPMASRLYLAMRSFLDSEGLDAMTIRCWPELPNTFGQWPYLGIARLVDEGRAVACEGDADGAMSAWIGENLGLGRAYLTDWLEHDHETITVWHGGAAPMGLCAPAGRTGRPADCAPFQHQEAGGSRGDAAREHAGHDHAVLALRWQLLPDRPRGPDYPAQAPPDGHQRAGAPGPAGRRGNGSRNCVTRACRITWSCLKGAIGALLRRLAGVLGMRFI